MSVTPPTPVEIRRIKAEDNSMQGIGLHIRWSDGEEIYLDSKILRTHCPCATCLERRGDSRHQKPLLSPLAKPKTSSLRVLSATAEEETALDAVWPIGNYAIGIRWQDKHDSGIYPYGLLKELSLEKNNDT